VNLRKDHYHTNPNLCIPGNSVPVSGRVQVHSVVRRGASVVVCGKDAHQAY